MNLSKLSVKMVIRKKSSSRKKLLVKNLLLLLLFLFLGKVFCQTQSFHVGYTNLYSGDNARELYVEIPILAYDYAKVSSDIGSGELQWPLGISLARFNSEWDFSNENVIHQATGKFLAMKFGFAINYSILDSKGRGAFNLLIEMPVFIPLIRKRKSSTSLAPGSNFTNFEYRPDNSGGFAPRIEILYKWIGVSYMHFAGAGDEVIMMSGSLDGLDRFYRPGIRSKRAITLAIRLNDIFNR